MKVDVKRVGEDVRNVKINHDFQSTLAKSRVLDDMKTCNVCGLEKMLTEYHKQARCKDGVRLTCKECIKVSGRQYYLDNKDIMIAKQRVYVRERYANDPVYRERTLKKTRDKAKRHKKRYQDRDKKRYANDPLYRLKGCLRARLSAAMSYGIKSAKTMELLGCHPEDFKTYLEAQFEPGMNWENYGHKGWHVDHIIPCAAFDLADPEQQRKCFHYTNMRPLWAKENLTKGAKLADGTDCNPRGAKKNPKS